MTLAGTEFTSNRLSWSLCYKFSIHQGPLITKEEAVEGMNEKKKTKKHGAPPSITYNIQLSKALQN